MFNTLLTSLLPRIVQDLITSSAALLTAHGFLAADDQQKYIGAAFFLVMLAINYVLHLSHGADAATAGANAAGGSIAPSTAYAIAKGKTPT